MGVGAKEDGRDATRYRGLWGEKGGLMVVVASGLVEIFVVEVSSLGWLARDHSFKNRLVVPR